MTAMLTEHRINHSGWLLRDRRPIWQWAENRVGMDRTRRRGERWHWKRTPWVKRILDDWQNIHVREVVLKAAAGAAKTTPMQVAVCWQVANDPCPIAWITCNDELAKDAAMERVTPMLENTPDTKGLMLPGYRDVTLRKVRTLYCSVDIGAASQQSTFEQRRYRVFIGDECRKWDPGALSKAQNRQIGYEDAKRAFCSTAGLAGDEFDIHYSLGNRAEWVIECMGCGQLIPFVWESKYSRLPEEWSKRAQMKYDDHRLWLECQCGHQHQETPEVKTWILEHGQWVDMNPESPVRVRSFHWPIFIVPWSKWNDEVLPKWKTAIMALKLGNVEMLKEFVQETLAESWEDSLHVEKSAIVKASYALADAGADWPFVFMTVDVGLREFWYVVRGWKKGAVSRLLEAKRVEYWQEIKDAATRFGLVMEGRGEGENGEPPGLALGKSRRVFIDANWEDPRSQEVHRTACEMGWTCFVGRADPYFEVETEERDERDKAIRERLLYSWPPRYYDSQVGIGGEQSAMGIEFRISDPTCQDILDELLAGKVGTFEYPSDIQDVYMTHMRNEPYVPGINKKTGRPELMRKRLGDQHLRDCEKMQVAAAAMAGCVAAFTPEKERKDD